MAWSDELLMANSEKKNPLSDAKFKGPNLFERLGEDLFGMRRPFDCIQIEVTSVCSAKCVYCPHTTQSASWKSRHISPQTFAALWPYLRKAARAHLQGWGEPLLNPHFFDFVNFALKAGCQVSSTSCGLFMNDENALKVAQSGMDMLAFSLVGTDEKSNDARVGAEFGKVCEGIRNLRRALSKTNSSMEIHLAYLLLADRMDALINLPDLMDDLDINTAIISTLDYLALPDQAELAFFPNEGEKIGRARKILHGISEKAKKSGRFIHYSLPSAKNQKYPGGCRENIARTLYADAEGKISPCVYLNVPGSTETDRIRVFGDITCDDPLAIWRSQEYTSFRNNLVNGFPDSACMECPKRYES